MENRFLCRGKRIGNGEWVEGFLVPFAGDDKNRFWQIKKVDDIKKPSISQTVRVNPSTICQCTGLKDKNGKLIFENDILSGHIDVEFPEDETRKRVVWHENGWCTNEPGCDDHEELDDFDSENFEVIGNIFDNPELLEV